MKRLYEIGKSFKDFIKEGNTEDRDKTLEYLNGSNLNDEIIDKIKLIDRNINILVLGEIWCPDCMINIPALELINSYNNKIDFRIIPREGNELTFKDYEVEGKVKIPTIVIMDEDFKELGSILERPKVFKDIYNSGNQVEIIKESKRYREGKYIDAMIEEILEIID